jgi:putative membrane-bound dehydrogenase-like protein
MARLLIPSGLGDKLRPVHESRLPNAMKLRSALVVTLLVTTFPLLAQKEKPLRVFIRVDEKVHSIENSERAKFLQDWTRLLNERGAMATGAARVPTRDELDRTDVLVITATDGNNLASEDRKSLERFVRRGGGLVALRDGILGTNGAWFKTLVGGAAEPARTNCAMGLTGLYLQDYQHPITQDVSNFDLDDGALYPIQINADAKVLATTFHTAKEIVPQMWTYEKGRGRAFVSLQGHRQSTFNLPHFRGLILRGIAWAGKRDVNSLIRPDELASFRYPAGGPTAPEQAGRKIHLSPEFDLTLVAAEPMVVKPISLDWDPRGRMWVAITPEYPFKQDKSPNKDAILILEDTDGDGRMDRRTAFCEGLNLVTSFVFHRDGVIVSQAPQILLLRDTNGDGKADKREVLFSGFGAYDTHAVVNNLRHGLDGWIYGCQGYSGTDSTNIVNGQGRKFGKIGNGIFRFKPDGSAIEQVSSYNGNSWGIDFSWDGELFFSKANGPHISHVVMPERYLSLGKLGNATSDKSIEDHRKVNPAFSDRRHEYVQVAPVGEFTAASGCTIYQGGAWPEKYHGSHFVCEPTVHIVHEDILTRAESPTFEATRRDDAEFLAGSDLWFRPVHTRVGPDGALYLLDFYNQAISHNDIRGIAHGKGNAAVRPDRDHLHGRIWRIQHIQARRSAVPALAAVPSVDLVGALLHPNAWVRWTAQRLLVEKPDLSVVPQLVSLLTNRVNYAKVHALWTLHQWNALADANLIGGITSAHPSVQNNALRIVSELRAGPSSNVVAAVVKQLKDTSERTRLDALLALTQWTPNKDTISAVHKLFSDLKDAKESWTKSAILGIARRAPTNFIRASFASDKSENYRELLAPLVEDFIFKKDGPVTAWILAHAARQAAGTDKLKIHVLQTLAKYLGDFAPPPSTNIAAAIRSLVKSENRAVKVAAYPLITKYDKRGSLADELASLRKGLLADLEKEKMKDEDRNSLITTVMTIEALQPQTIERLDALLARGVSREVQKHIINELSRTKSPLVPATLIGNYSKLGSENKQLALGTLVKRSDWADTLLDAIAKKTIELSDLGVQGPSRLLTHPDAAIAKKAATIVEAIRGPQTREKDALIAHYLAYLDKPADLKNGKELFEKNCAVCHKFGDRGKDVGPTLTGVGLHGPRVLLTHILDPNRVIEGNFVSYNLVTKKDEDYTGLIKSENNEKVTLRNIEGEVEVRRADIATFKSSGLSLMPEGLEALGEKNIADIVAYLTTTVPKGFRPLNLASAFTADSRKGLYAVQSDSPSLAFKQFGIVMVDNIPFDIVNPVATPRGNNVVVLKGGSGFAKSLPQHVEFPVGTKAKKIYVLGGVAGWGFPYGAPDAHDVPAAKAMLEYSDGQTEEVIWKNGEEFADYVRPYEVPGSKSAGDLLTAGQLRWFAIVPKRRAEIKTIRLESFNNQVAPTFVAMTAQTE